MADIVLIGVLGNSESWYVRELQRAGGELGHEVVRFEFSRIVAACGQRNGGKGIEAQVADGCREMLDISALSPAQEQGSSSRATLNPLDLTEFNAVIIRTMPPGSLEQVVYRMDVLARL